MNNRFDVSTRFINSDGAWEEWVVQVSASDDIAALAKVLRRRLWAEQLLEAAREGGRFRFKVDAVGLQR